MKIDIVFKLFYPVLMINKNNIYGKICTTSKGGSQSWERS
jgi:hypothetical protein